MNRVPPSSRPPGEGGPKAPASTTTTTASKTQAKKTKTLGSMKKVELKADPVSVEAALWSGQDTDNSLEMSQAALESRLAQLDANEEHVTADNPLEGELSGEKADPAKSARRGSGQKSPGKPAASTGAGPALWKRSEPKAARTPRGADSVPGATSGPNSGSTSGPHGATAKRPAMRPELTGASYSNLSAVGSALSGGALRPERAPDAWSLLREAKEAGVFFREDSMREGHTEADEDPELAAAVEEAIRLLFGVRGILRVGSGKNEKNESIVIVVASHGFSDASLASVPEKVHRFRTVVAIPFELLPLRRDR